MAQICIHNPFFFSLVGNGIFLFNDNLFNSKEKYNYSLPNSNNFSFLDPNIAGLDIQNFLQIREIYIASYKPLRIRIENILADANGHFGVYFEDLVFHSWIGVNEKELFTPASLLKVSTVSSILKMVENGELSLDTEVTLNYDDLNSRFGELYQKEGSKLTIKKLIEIAIVESDNSAAKALHQFMPENMWIETRLAMGLPLVSITKSESGETFLTPKEFSSLFRSLYFSGYLRRTYSNWLLSLMASTNFNEGIPAGVPKDVKVAHKVGLWQNEGSVHDCGIVYANRPYILCIMSRDTTLEEGNRVIKEISQEVYKYIYEID